MGPRARAGLRYRRSRSKRPDRRRRSKCSASPARRTPAIAWRWSRTKRAPAKSPITAPARSARRRPRAPTGMRGSLEQMMAQAKTSGRKEFPLVIKADVQGSLEAIVGALDKLGTDEVAARVLHAGVGGISESDVTLAEASGVADHRLQRARQQGSARGGRARRHRDPLLQHHLRPRRRREEGDVRPAARRRCARPCSATRRSWRSSRSPRSARSPAAASPTAPSSAAPMCG